MARRWTAKEEEEYRNTLRVLYVEQNRTIGEIGAMLGIAPQTVFGRLKRLGISTCRDKKDSANNRRMDIVLPTVRSTTLAELFGILMGDGHVGHFQVVVTLGVRERAYARHVCGLFETVFGSRPRISHRHTTGHQDIYLGSTAVTGWLKQQGFVSHKVAGQPDVPDWIFAKQEYMTAFLRGFFDTDGSVYALRHGRQISFSNRSLPLLRSLQKVLRTLGYSPSAVSGWQLYLTKSSEIERFFREIQPANTKHKRRFSVFK
jgi:DNA-binding transcriptional regulator WhiA